MKEIRDANLKLTHPIVQCTMNIMNALTHPTTCSFQTVHVNKDTFIQYALCTTLSAKSGG